MSFTISYVDKKFCKSTKIKVLEDVDICLNCQQIPLPSYRSYLHPDKIFCKKCFEVLKFDHYIIMVPPPTRDQIIKKTDA